MAGKNLTIADARELGRAFGSGMYGAEVKERNPFSRSNQPRQHAAFSDAWKKAKAKSEKKNPIKKTKRKIATKAKRLKRKGVRVARLVDGTARKAKRVIAKRSYNRRRKLKQYHVRVDVLSGALRNKSLWLTVQNGMHVISDKTNAFKGTLEQARIAAKKLGSYLPHDVKTEVWVVEA